MCLGIWLLYLENLNAHEWSEMKEKYNIIIVRCLKNNVKW